MMWMRNRRRRRRAQATWTLARPLALARRVQRMTRAARCHQVACCPPLLLLLLLLLLLCPRGAAKAETRLVQVIGEVLPLERLGLPLLAAFA